MTANYEIDYDIAMPDTSIGYSEMDLYGYKGAAILPLLTDRALELFDADHTIYMLYENGTEAMVFEREEITAHDGIFGIEASEWIASLEYADIIKALYNSKSSRESALMNDNYSAMYDESERFDHTIEKPQTAHADTSEQIAPEKNDKPQPVTQPSAEKKPLVKSNKKVKRSILAQIEDYKTGAANAKESLKNATEHKNKDEL